MPHVALYRKYRSQTFGDLVGQDHVVKTLTGAVASGRHGHAYLFTGPRGTGKTSTARLLAKALNCPNVVDGEPCGTCDVCLSIADGSSMDVVEIDAASESGVDDVRERIVEASEYKPSIGPFRIFIIDEVHDLSSKAFDALLKTIEEPPGHIVFILATTEYGKVPPTIRSRCQKFEFHRANMGDLVSRLEHVIKAEGGEADPSALSAIAKMADGGFRDALTLLEQALMTAEGPLTLEHVAASLGLIDDDTSDKILLGMTRGEVPMLIEEVERVYQTGRDPRSILESLLHRLSDLTRIAFGLEGAFDPALEAASRSTAAEIGTERMLRFRAELAEAHRVIRDMSLPRIWLESELIRISQMVNAPAPAPVQAAAPQPQPAAPAKAEPPKQTPPTPRQEAARAPVQKTEPPQEKETPAPSRPKPQPTGPAHPQQDVWDAIVTDLCEKSKLAKMRLPGSRLAEVAPGKVVVEFAQQTNARWARDNAALGKAIRSLWESKTGDAAEFDFVASATSSAPKAPVEEKRAAVELPIEGPRLAEVAKEIFKDQLSSGQDGNEVTQE